MCLLWRQGWKQRSFVFRLPLYLHSLDKRSKEIIWSSDNTGLERYSHLPVTPEQEQTRCYTPPLSFPNSHLYLVPREELKTPRRCVHLLIQLLRPLGILSRSASHLWSIGKTISWADYLWDSLLSTHIRTYHCFILYRLEQYIILCKFLFHFDQ